MGCGGFCCGIAEADVLAGGDPAGRPAFLMGPGSRGAAASGCDSTTGGVVWAGTLAAGAGSGVDAGGAEAVEGAGVETGGTEGLFAAAFLQGPNWIAPTRIPT